MVIPVDVCIKNINEELWREFDRRVKSFVKMYQMGIVGFKEVHDKTRNKIGLFDKIIENIETLNVFKKKRNVKKPVLTIKIVLVDSGLDDIESFCEYCEEILNAHTVNISLEKTKDHAQFSHKLYSDFRSLAKAGSPEIVQYKNPERVIEILLHLLSKYKKRKMDVVIYPKMTTRAQLENYFYGNKFKMYETCNLPWSLVTIMPAGDVIPCLSYRVGNLKDYDFNINKLLQGDKRSGFLEQLKRQQNGKMTPAACNCCCFIKF